MVILLHSSKTMRHTIQSGTLRQPQLIKQAERLAAFIKTLSAEQLAKAMHISNPLAQRTQQTYADWTSDPSKLSLALDTFVGDIYSGLRASDLSDGDRDYADQTIRILSGLYGVIRPYDGISPYRLEMAYRLPSPEFANLYTLWDEAIAKCLTSEGPVINVSSVEYTRAVIPFLDAERIVTPKFLTINPATGEPTFVVVHAKIARGAFARWLVTSRITDVSHFVEFQEIGYKFDKKLSTPREPAFVCQTFGGKGLSMRLS